MKQQEEAEPVPEQTEECMLTEIRSDVLQKFRRERGSREDRIREGSRPIETEECRRVLRRYQGRNIQVTSNVDLNKIKQIALGRLGMKYPSDDQTVTYSTSGNSYVRQYQDIPDSK